MVVYLSGKSCSFEEWLNPLAQAVIKYEERKLFRESGSRSGVFLIEGNDQDKIKEDDCLMFEFFGRIMALCLLHNVSLNISLSETIYGGIIDLWGWLPSKSFDQDLKYLEEEGIPKKYPELWEFLTSSSCIGIYSDEKIIQELNLMPGESREKISPENRASCVESLVNSLIIAKKAKQIDALKVGFYALVPSDALGQYTMKDLEKAISGPRKGRQR
jgi:hypothetical protein